MSNPLAPDALEVAFAGHSILLLILLGYLAFLLAKRRITGRRALPLTLVSFVVPILGPIVGAVLLHRSGDSSSHINHQKVNPA